jgi:hypothetical protein
VSLRAPHMPVAAKVTHVLTGDAPDDILAYFEQFEELVGLLEGGVCSYQLLMLGT